MLSRTLVYLNVTGAAVNPGQDLSWRGLVHQARRFIRSCPSARRRHLPEYRDPGRDPNKSAAAVGPSRPERSVLRGSSHPRGEERIRLHHGVSSKDRNSGVVTDMACHTV